MRIQYPVRIPTKKKFIFIDEICGGTKADVSYDVFIPTATLYDFSSLFGHFVVETKLPEIFYANAKKQLKEFVLIETQKYEDELADAAVLDFLQGDYANDFDYETKFQMNCGINANFILTFDETFNELMNNGKTEELLKLIRLESKMTENMNKLLSQRDQELHKLRLECEAAVEKTKEASDLEEHSYNLSVLNEKLRNTNSNFCNQLKSLTERQRSEYANVVSILQNNGVFPDEKLASHSDLSTPSSYTPIEPVLDESFTIYIGNQLKSMHNARLLQYRSLGEFCHDDTVDAMERSVYESSRLNSLISLYRRDLKAAIILVERDPLYHLHARTEFYKLCEKSVELHFDPIDVQLRKIADRVPLMNQSQRASHSNQRCFESTEPRCPDDYEFFRPGDVYVTTHSNLSNVQVVFHLVTDQHWDKVDLTSRHPYINGLGNCIRMASKNAVGTMTFPLFLNKNVPKDQPLPYYQSRADLIFKCLKGLLIEVCSTGASNSNCAAFNQHSVHYNINFGIPEYLGQKVFETISDVLLQVFHLVPTVNVTDEMF
ncbi:unnamed protein product [Bursaphelenchus okinawaensis]|uniref:Uncharacterized protein n=1 Tax=Bursaphelenchus okinawaensis TaxID=465554 RepID=A0A811KI40_9BILA|nr:unnamed protein product [Bursaphelenchus okinawaensis]CAG9102856.1 unnamed protein product [Bursaphelenchus okinawaensis]